MTIGITGATGQLGTLVVNKLKGLLPADNIVALVRSPEKAAALDVGVRRIDYDQPETLETAFAGIDKLLLISSNEIGERGRQHRNVIDAAKKSGVSHFVYTSLLHADTSPLSLAAEHWDTEAALKSSGLPYTVLRNGWYTENYTGSILGAVTSGQLIGAAGEGKLSTATREDYAAAAVEVLTTPNHVGETYELAGDTTFTLAEMAAEVAHQTGRNIRFENLSEQQYAETLRSFGLPDHLSAAIASWDIAASKDALFHDGRQLRDLIGRPTTTLAQAVTAALVSVPAG